MLFRRISLNDYVSTAFILLSLVVLLHTSGLFSRVDNLMFDIGQKLYQKPAPADIIIVAIDENSLSELGRWPWSRKVHANLINRLKQDGALVIGLDIIFAEPDLLDMGADEALAESILQANNVVLPVLLESTRANGQLIETLPLPSLTKNAIDLGRVHAALDEDGIARSIYIYEGIGAPVWQHFSQAVLNVAQKKSSQNQFKLVPDEKNMFSLVRKNQQRISFLGPPGHFSSISYAQVLNGEFAKNTFNNKIVLVGATASGMSDVLSTPVSGLGQPMAGVEFHANVLESIRSKQLIQPLPAWLTMLVLLTLALMPLIWMPKLSALTGLISTLVFFVLVALLAAVLPKAFGLWFAPSAALLPILISYPVWSWRKLESAQRYLDQELVYLKNLMHTPVIAIETHSYDSFDDRIQQVREATQQLRLLQDDKKEVLAFISHDLRAPLARAMMLLEDNQQLKQQLKAPLSQALNLAEDFLQASRAEMTNSADFKELDFAGITHQSVDDAFESAKKKNIKLEREIVDAVVWVNGNFGLLQRAILNLVLNAVKFSPENATVTIKLNINQNVVKVGGSNIQATLSIIDNGPGIPIDEQKKLFKRFSRTKNESTIADGAGLGLYFVHTVAEKHQGSVNVESDLGKLTSFNLMLPVISFEFNLSNDDSE